MPIEPGEKWDRRLSAVRTRIRKLENLHTKSVDKFNATLDELVRLKTEEEALFIVKSIVINAFARLVDRTPVDTGRARAGWIFEIDTPSLWIPPKGAYEKLQTESRSAVRAAVADELEKIENATPGAVWFIVNNVEYIEALEAGHSVQAKPYGMLGLTLNELRNQLRRKIEL